MSKAANSPTARLLQSSRLFSLPRPLPQPALELISSTGIYRASESATLPFPTHQAIATPASSHFRGDWGLKRPLPAKATRGTSTPHIRIAAQDTPEHITDFGSAADHTLNEAKWREMGVPMLVKLGPSENGATPWSVSVFEDGIDNTDEGQKGMSDDGRTGKQRWKHSGPWLAGMQDGEFEAYVQRLGDRRTKNAKGTTARGGRERWREFLRQYIADKRLAEERRKATEEGAIETLAEREKLRQSLIPTDKELPAIEKGLRDAHQIDNLSSELTAVICAFLDLPAVYASAMAGSDFQQRIKAPMLKTLVNRLVSNEAPPSTHPSAGLSYLRTSAIMNNHPVHGPQAHRSPVLSRVIRPRNSVRGNESNAKVGVGGFVAEDPISLYHNPARMGSRVTQSEVGGYDPDLMANALDPDLPGGNKMWVQPLSASVDSQGRVRLQLNRGDKEAVAVQMDDVEHIHEARAAATRGTTASAGFSAPPPPSANFGTALPDYSRLPPWLYSSRTGDDHDAPRIPGSSVPYPGQRGPAAPSRSGVRGFDEELNSGSQQGAMSRETQASRIADMFRNQREGR